MEVRWCVLCGKRIERHSYHFTVPHERTTCSRKCRANLPRKQYKSFRPIEERFWEKVDKRGPNECWIWKAGRAGSDGRYGKFSANSHDNYAHRISYELNVGPIPEGKLVIHSCHNGLCVNPRHLRLGTQKDNMDDKFKAGRENMPVGEKNARSKLTAKDVIQIRSRGNDAYATLGREFGVTKQSIFNVVHRKNWKHI